MSNQPTAKDLPRVPRGEALKASALGLLQLGAFTGLVYLFRIEGEALFQVLAFACAGLFVSALVPPSRRQLVFLATSIAVGFATLGAGGMLLVGVAAAAIVGVARLSPSTKVRWVVVTVVMALLAILRGWPRAQAMLEALDVTPDRMTIIGSIFAFRAFMFVYDTNHGLDKVPVAQQLSYFVLLPNFALPLFPLVDYRTFATKHTPEPTAEDVDRGGRMLLAGFAHLICYRLVYHYMIVDASARLSIADRITYIASFYLLYLRVSGLFHTVVGILLFFGYRLPPTHEAHLTSKNWGDFWRRTNVYWKDFNQKFIFSPIAAVLSRRVRRHSLELAVFTSLVISWAVHSYQFFFVYGQPLLAWRDMSFWLILAVGMVVSAVREQRRKPKSKLAAKRPPTMRERLYGLVQMAVFYVMISFLWSAWSAPSWDEWVRVVGFRG